MLGFAGRPEAKHTRSKAGTAGEKPASLKGKRLQLQGGRLLKARAGRGIAVACFFLALPLSCGRTWDLAQPFAISIDSPEIPVAAARLYLTAALGQLGAHVGSSATQVVHVAYDARCSCASCNPYTVAHTERLGQDTIQVCPGYLNEPADGLQDNLTHELGHVLGLWSHLPCETGAMMTPQYNCRRDHVHYQALDVQAICGAGGAFNGVCG